MQATEDEAILDGVSATRLVIGQSATMTSLVTASLVTAQ